MATYQIPGFYMGEVSPRFFGRTDLPQYPYGCKTMLNAFPNPTGPAQKRPGTIYYGHAAKGAAEVALVPFKIDQLEMCVIAMEPGGARVLYEDGSEVYAFASYPYGTADLHDIDYVQLGDDMWFVHPDYMPRKLTRTTPAGVETWTWTTASFTVAVVDGFVDFSDADGSGNNPSLIEFYEGRLVFAATNNDPGYIWFSEALNFTNFTQTATVEDTDPIAFHVQPSKRAKILWIAAEDALVFGTQDAPFRLGGPEIAIDATQTIGWWPTRQGGEGGYKLKPVIANGSVVYGQRGGQKLRAFAYLDTTAKYMSTDLNMSADHILQARVKEGFTTMAYQNAPFGITWVVDTDGQLCSFVASPMSGSIGWSCYDFGGPVLSICVTTTSEGEDRLWLAIDRGANGISYEYLSPMYQDTVYMDQTVELDAGAAITFTDIVNENFGVGDDRCRIDSVAHGLSDGDLVKLLDIAEYPELSGEVFKVADQVADSFYLQYISGDTYYELTGDAGTTGTAAPVINTATLLPYDDGDVVQILIDGSYTGEETVETLSVSTTEYGRFMTIGRGFETIIEPLDIPVAIQNIKRPYKLYARFYESYGLDAGPDRSNLERFKFTTGTLYLDTPPELISSMVEINFQASGSLLAPIYTRSNIPLPLVIVSMIIEFTVGGTR